jgi:hypothetical protein
MGKVYFAGDVIEVDRLYKDISNNTFKADFNNIEVLHVSGIDWDTADFRWEGITPIIIEEDDYILWSGVVLLNESSSQIISPSKKLSECEKGWMLVWSKFDLETGVNDKFMHSYIHKTVAKKHNGSTHLLDMLSSITDTEVKSTGKLVQVFDDKIVGSTENDSIENLSSTVVLRYVLEW